MSTVFGLIIQGKIPAKKVFENEHVLAIEDINPVAPIHILIMPKKEVKSVQQLEDENLLVEIWKAARHIAEEKGIEDGYRLLTNCGSDAGQTVFHLHFHLIGGRVLGAIA